MTNDELEAIRHLPGSENAQAFVSVVQLWKLLDYVDELHGVIHDLRQEPGYELGRQEERHRAQQLIREAATHCATTDSADIIGQLAQDIEALGPVAPHLAPDDLRRENEALRRQREAAYDVVVDFLAWHREETPHSLLARAQRLLDEDDV